MKMLSRLYSTHPQHWLVNDDDDDEDDGDDGDHDDDDDDDDKL